VNRKRIQAQAMLSAVPEGRLMIAQRFSAELNPDFNFSDFHLFSFS